MWIEISAQKFKYFIPKEESTAIQVSKDTRNVIKFFAKTGGMTMVAATYFVIREGFTYLGEPLSTRLHVTCLPITIPHIIYHGT